jgi:anti-sigma regulatory factor (Ser/Thr protein kinase)
MLVTIKNDLGELETLRQAVHEFSAENKLNQDIVFALDLCIEELISNIIFYGYNDGKQHPIELNLTLENDFVVLQIKDQGEPFDPTQRPAPDLDVPLEERQIGGLGLHLVRHYMDSFEYLRDGVFNVTTLKKRAG